MTKSILLHSRIPQSLLDLKHDHLMLKYADDINRPGDQTTSWQYYKNIRQRDKQHPQSLESRPD